MPPGDGARLGAGRARGGISEPAGERQAARDVPILMLTAIHATTPLRFAPDQEYLPVDAFIEKPIEPEVLLARVREQLAKRAA